MKFLLDVNASGSAAYWLRLLGHDVVQVSNENPRMSDDQILSETFEKCFRQSTLADSSSRKAKILIGGIY